MMIDLNGSLRPIFSLQFNNNHNFSLNFIFCGVTLLQRLWTFSCGAVEVINVM